MSAVVLSLDTYVRKAEGHAYQHRGRTTTSEGCELNFISQVNKFMYYVAITN